MHQINDGSRRRAGRISLGLALSALAAGLPAADDTVRAGRYLDRNVEVHDAAQLDPLAQVVDLSFSPRVPVREALNTALSGTGYRLAALDQAPARRLLDSRLAFPHTRFERKRVGSVVRAIVGRGFEVSVDHVGRQVVVGVQGGHAPEAAEPVRRPGVLNRFFGRFAPRTSARDGEERNR